MAEPKGDKLYVNLSAAQTRRRLKGFGHGVRKIQSGGKNQAVVIHTATGAHLEQLKGKFADVGYSESSADLGQPIDNLRNIGPASAGWLREAGIQTIADLQRLGPATAYRIVKQRHPAVSRNLLWALTAGLSDCDWRELTAVQKERLLREVDDD